MKINESCRGSKLHYYWCLLFLVYSLNWVQLFFFFFFFFSCWNHREKETQKTANTHFAEPKYNPADNICIFYITFALIFSSTSGLDTPVELKLKLIPMLQHMHHDASLASSSRELLQHLVNSYPSTPMVIVSLHTFTQLAASSLIDIPKQVDPTCSHTAMPPFFRFVVVNLWFGS